MTTSLRARAIAVGLVGIASCLTLGLATPASATTPLATPTVSVLATRADWGDFLISDADLAAGKVKSFTVTVANTDPAKSTDKASLTVTPTTTSTSWSYLPDWTDFPIEAKTGDNYTIRVQATPNDTATYSASAASAAATFTTPGTYLDTPYQLFLHGSFAVGSTVTVSTTTLDLDGYRGWNAGTRVSYRWYLDPRWCNLTEDCLGDLTGTLLTTTTAPSLVVPAKAYGHNLVVEAVGHLQGYQDTALDADTLTMRTVSAGALRMQQPVIHGKAAVGKRLRVSVGAWTPGTTFTYRWAADGAPIKKAKGPTLKLRAAQRHRRITVTVVGHPPRGYQPADAAAGATLTSKATRPVS